LTSTTAASAEATDQIVLGTGTFTQLDPYSSFPKVVNAPLKLVISSATNVVLYYTGKVDVGLSDALGKADLDRKIVTITSCNWTDNPAKGTIDYSSGTLTGEVDCFEAGNNSSPYLKITMP
jgi:hypothetical protein